MKDILIIRAISKNIGGIEGQVLRIAKDLALRKLFNPILATSNRSSLFARRFKELGFSVYEIPMGRRDIFKGAKVIELILKKHNIALIQSHMFRESFIARKVRLKHPKIPHVFRAHTYIDCAWVPKQKKFAYHLLDKLTSKYVDRYVGNGEVLAKEIINRSWISSGKIRVVWDGCDQIGSPDPSENSLNTPLPSKIAMVSNYSLHKGHDILIKSLALLKQKGLNVHTRLIGGESINNGITSNMPVTDNLKREASKMRVLNQIEFFGYTQNVYEALQGFPVLVLPSDSEGIPNCILEAISLRKLVIASNVGGIPEIIENGVNGLLHPPHDPEVLADIIEWVFTTPAKTWEPMRDAGYKTWKEQFSMEKMMSKLIRIYDELGALE